MNGVKRVCFEGLQVHVERGGLENVVGPSKGAKKRQSSAKEEYRILEAANEGQIDIKLGHSSRPAEVAKLDLRIQVTLWHDLYLL